MCVYVGVDTSTSRIIILESKRNQPSCHHPSNSEHRLYYFNYKSVKSNSIKCSVVVYLLYAKHSVCNYHHQATYNSKIVKDQWRQRLTCVKSTLWSHSYNVFSTHAWQALSVISHMLEPTQVIKWNKSYEILKSMFYVSHILLFTTNILIYRYEI